LAEAVLRKQATPAAASKAGTGVGPAKTPRSVANAGPTARTANGTRQAAAMPTDDGADSHELFGIGDLCAEFGITARAVRFYEDKGLLKPRRVNGTRIYTRRDRTRLALILRSKAIGASLTEIKHFLELYGTHGEGRVQQMKYVLARTDEAIAQLETKRAHIDTTLAELRAINDAVRRSAFGASPSRGRRQRPEAGSAAAARSTENSP
jgi:DNA-binding transcriptional MerR regulator